MNQEIINGILKLSTLNLFCLLGLIVSSALFMSMCAHLIKHNNITLALTVILIIVFGVSANKTNEKLNKYFEKNYKYVTKLKKEEISRREYFNKTHLDDDGNYSINYHFYKNKRIMSDKLKYANVFIGGDKYLSKQVKYTAEVPTYNVYYTSLEGKQDNTVVILSNFDEASSDKLDFNKIKIVDSSDNDVTNKFSINITESDGLTKVSAVAIDKFKIVDDEQLSFVMKIELKKD